MRSFFRFVMVLAPGDDGDDVKSQQDSIKSLGSCDSFLHWANEDEFGFDFQEDMEKEQKLQLLFDRFDSWKGNVYLSLLLFRWIHEGIKSTF
jgi:hypothetical protein